MLLCPPSRCSIALSTVKKKITSSQALPARRYGGRSVSILMAWILTPRIRQLMSDEGLEAATVVVTQVTLWTPKATANVQAAAPVRSKSVDKGGEAFEQTVIGWQTLVPYGQRS